MNIIYLSSVCSQNRFDSLVECGRIDGQFQNQKFHHLLLMGLIENGDHNIQVISFCPQKRNSKVLYKLMSEEENGIHYIYPGYIDRPFVNPISRFITTLNTISKIIKKDSVIVCNIMNFEECLAALYYRQFHRRTKICAIVADVPGLTSGANRVVAPKWKKWLGKIRMSFIVRANKQYDGYMFLAEAMNSVVNSKNKPYTAVEGLTDLKLNSINNELSNKNIKPIVLYAGGLHREYGIEWLVESFQRIPDQNVELHIYGHGNYEKDLIERAKSDKRVKYLGTKNNNEIVEEQIKAHILVNPRPTHAEYVKYSFPSKVMESMASGTPLLTTRLPSMPEDYYPYVYFIEPETIQGLQDCLSSLLKLNPEELHKKGCAAKKFVLEQKNYRAQAKKLINLITTI